MPSAQLTVRSWFFRAWVLRCGEALYTVTYNGWGLGTESVSVNGFEVVRRQGLVGSMTHGYRFMLDDGHLVSVAVAVPWWCDLLPLRDLSFARVDVNGEVLYEEGRPPRRTMRWTGPARAFPVIPVPPPLPSSPPPLPQR